MEVKAADSLCCVWRTDGSPGLWGTEGSCSLGHYKAQHSRLSLYRTGERAKGEKEAWVCAVGDLCWKGVYKG